MTNVTTLLPQHLSALLTTDYTWEQELQVFTSTQGKALKTSVKGLRWFLCSWVSSYQVRWASPATLHCSLIKPLPWSVTDQGDLALSLPPKSCSQTLSTGPWCVGITDWMPQTLSWEWLRLSSSVLFASGSIFCPLESTQIPPIDAGWALVLAAIPSYVSSCWFCMWWVNFLHSVW